MKLKLFIQPNAKKNELVGLHNGALKVKIASPPVEGKANAELIEFLAETLGIPKRQVELLKGETGRNKTVEIHGLTEAEVHAKLGL